MELGLDWKLAIQRLGKDIRDDFWPDPLGLKDLLGAPEAVLSRLEPQLKSYRPGRGVSYSIPKANLTIRDSIHLTPLDRLVYQALIDRLIPHCDPAFSPTAFSHRLQGPQSKWIFHPMVRQYKKFLNAVKAKLLEGPGGFLVKADITQYFENVRFRPLHLQLQNILGESKTKELQSALDTLLACLKGWSPYDGYGLAQGVDASSFLGNVLLDLVDRHMQKEGYSGFRYMDDIRVVVACEADARIAMVKLVSVLRGIGLAVNAAKTEILGPAEAQEYLRDKDPEISQIENALETKTREAVQSIVDVLFQKTRRLIRDRRTGEGAFRFCLYRIAVLRAYRNVELPPGEDITDEVLRLLVSRPGDTHIFCRYLEVAPLNKQEHERDLERLLVAEPLCVYPWQNFHLWRLVAQRKIESSELTRRAHMALAKPTCPEAAGAALYLGARGDYADRQRTAKMARDATHGLVRRCYQVAIQELNKAERSTAYSEICGDDPDARLLADYVQGLHEPTYVAYPPRLEVEDLLDAMPSVYG